LQGVFALVVFFDHAIPLIAVEHDEVLGFGDGVVDSHFFNHEWTRIFMNVFVKAYTCL
ncbi:MAG: hypothetical protein GY845_07175, partial [Planctomycetes bacterium]|nr:hypothetical protein [Planctomycetota bacterium]